jgi:hypothetical protein
MTCHLAIAFLIGFVLAGVAARVLGHRASLLRLPQALPTKTKLWARYDPAAYTARGNMFRRWALALAIVAFVCIVAVASLVVLGPATCWPAI